MKTIPRLPGKKGLAGAKNKENNMNTSTRRNPVAPGLLLMTANALERLPREDVNVALHRHAREYAGCGPPWHPSPPTPTARGCVVLDHHRIAPASDDDLAARR